MSTIVELSEGTYEVQSAKYHRNGVGGRSFYVGQVVGLKGECEGEHLSVLFLSEEDGTLEDLGAIPVFVTMPSDPSRAFRGDYFVSVAQAAWQMVQDEWDRRLAPKIEEKN